MSHQYVHVTKYLLGHPTLYVIEIVAGATYISHHYLSYMYVLVGQTMDDSSLTLI